MNELFGRQRSLEPHMLALWGPYSPVLAGMYLTRKFRRMVTGPFGALIMSLSCVENGGCAVRVA